MGASSVYQSGSGAVVSNVGEAAAVVRALDEPALSIPRPAVGKD
jgi:hypothetical protein